MKPFAAAYDLGRLEGAVRNLLSAWRREADITPDMLALTLIYNDVLKARLRDMAELSQNEAALNDYLEELEALAGMGDEA